MSLSTCPSSLPHSLLLLLPLLFLFFLIPFDLGHFQDLLHVLTPAAPQNETLLGHELLPSISHTSAIAEEFTSSPLPPFTTITNTNTSSQIPQDFSDGNLISFYGITPEANAPQASVDLSDGLLSHFNATSDTNPASGIAVTSEEQLVAKKMISSLERIEVGLARARAAIRKAVLTRNYTSEKEESYVPRGPVYRNANVFHQLKTKMITSACA